MILFVGGHGRKAGKSAVICGLIRALPQAGWIAIKVSRHRHGEMSRAGVVEQTSADATDSGRYLAAGAVRSYWAVLEGDSAGGPAGELLRILAGSANAVVESASLAAWIKPDLFLFVVDPAAGEWKPSAEASLKLADAFVLVDRGPATMPRALPADRPRFLVRPPEFVSQELVAFIRARLAAQPACGNVATRES